MNAYLDASAILPMLVEEGASRSVDAFVAAHKGSLVVSAFAAGEVASAVSRLVRTGHVSPEEGRDLLDNFEAWRVSATVPAELAAGDVHLALGYVRRFELMLRMPDALHIAACRRMGHVLVTLDHRMGSAAEALGVAVETLK